MFPCLEVFQRQWLISAGLCSKRSRIHQQRTKQSWHVGCLHILHTISRTTSSHLEKRPIISSTSLLLCGVWHDSSVQLPKARSRKKITLLLMPQGLWRSDAFYDDYNRHIPGDSADREDQSGKLWPSVSDLSWSRSVGGSVLDALHHLGEWKIIWLSEYWAPAP